MQAIKCVVVGDGAVGKSFYELFQADITQVKKTTNPMLYLSSIFRKNMSTNQLYNKCLPR